MQRLFGNKVSKTYKEMSHFELERVVNKLVKENDLATLKAIVDSGVALDFLPCGRDPLEKLLNCKEKFLLSYLAQNTIDLKMLSYIYRNVASLPTLGNLTRDGKATKEEIKYILMECFIRNNQDYLKKIWASYPDIHFSAQEFKNHVASKDLTSEHITSATCCLAYMLKKNRTTPVQAEEIGKFLDSKTVCAVKLETRPTMMS